MIFLISTMQQKSTTSVFYISFFPSFPSVCQLEELCSSETVQTDITDELQEVPRSSVILDQLDSDCPSECSQRGVPAHLSSVYLLVSAMEGEKNSKHRTNTAVFFYFY